MKIYKSAVNLQGLILKHSESGEMLAGTYNLKSPRSFLRK